MYQVSKNSNKNKRWGFTVTEFLIVIAIVAILSAIGLINLYGKKSREGFDNAVTKIVTLLETASSNSVTQKTIYSGIFGNWRVRFIPNGCIDGPSVTLQQLDVAAPSQDRWKNMDRYVLPKGVDFDWGATFFQEQPCVYDEALTGELRELYYGKVDINNVFVVKNINFYSLTGIPTVNTDYSNVSQVPSVKIHLVSNPTISSTISVSPLGQVNYTIDGGVLGQ